MRKAKLKRTFVKPEFLAEYVTRGEAAALLGLSVRTLAGLDAKRAGPKSIIYSGKRWYRKSEVETWLTKRLKGK